MTIPKGFCWIYEKVSSAMCDKSHQYHVRGHGTARAHSLLFLSHPPDRWKSAGGSQVTFSVVPHQTGGNRCLDIDSTQTPTPPPHKLQPFIKVHEYSTISFKLSIPCWPVLTLHSILL